MTALDELLKRAGWKAATHGWNGKSQRKYRVVEELAPGTWDRSAVPFLAKAILQARANVPKGVEPVAALRVKQATPLTNGRLAAFVEEFVPGQAWVLLDDSGRFFPHVASAPELLDAVPDVVHTKRDQRPQRSHSLFSDLNQWMLKVLLAPRFRPEHLSAPRDLIPRNASMLAQVANVSMAVADRFVRALETEGHLDTRFGDLRLSRPLELLELWKSRTGGAAREEMSLVFVRGAFDFKVLEANARRLPDFVRGTHAACDFLGLHHVSGFTPMVWSRSIDLAALKSAGLLRDSAGRRVDLVMRRPRFPETIFRAAVGPDGKRAATDVIQCWLDTSHERVRGEEQADYLWRKVIKPALS